MKVEDERSAIEARRAADREDLTAALRRLRSLDGRGTRLAALALGGLGAGCFLGARQASRAAQAGDEGRSNAAACVAGAAALGMGAAIASALPVTKIENRLLGSTGDAMRNRAAVQWEEDRVWAGALVGALAAALVDGAEEGIGLAARRAARIVADSGDDIAARIARI